MEHFHDGLLTAAPKHSDEWRSLKRILFVHGITIYLPNPALPGWLLEYEMSTHSKKPNTSFYGCVEPMILVHDIGCIAWYELL
jgi:hypothetical protein